MTQKFVNRRMIITLFFVASLVLCQFVPRMENFAKVPCDQGLSTGVFERFYSRYGFPVSVVITHSVIDRCSGEEKTNIYAGPILAGLLIDILFIAISGALIYWAFGHFDRIRVSNVRLLTVFFIAVTVLCQFIPLHKSDSFYMDCGVFPYSNMEQFSVMYGFPIPIVGVSVTINPCSGDYYSFGDPSVGALLVDILFIAGFVTSPYWFLALLRRFRRRENAA